MKIEDLQNRILRYIERNGNTPSAILLPNDVSTLEKLTEEIREKWGAAYDIQKEVEFEKGLDETLFGIPVKTHTGVTVELCD